MLACPFTDVSLVLDDLEAAEEVHPDKQPQAPVELDAARALAHEAIGLYHTITRGMVANGGLSMDAALQQQIGRMPTVKKDGPAPVSHWMSAACAQHPDCADRLERLLLGTSTERRLKSIVAFQKRIMREALRQHDEAPRSGGGSAA